MKDYDKNTKGKFINSSAGFSKHKKISFHDEPESIAEESSIWVAVLKDINIEIKLGEFVAIVGEYYRLF